MKVKIWVVSTCVPGETDPCQPSVFGTAAEADTYLDTMLRAEWDTNQPHDDDGEPMPYPGDVQAQETLAVLDCWGKWEITEHDVEVPL